ncbi:sulfurtransferase-like selenium metabolism protein YedF [Enterococcus rivorum]|uniref:UPF0033 domain-containing protein n=1 Tax=Enterococcus rivorum TaxID=762845 RepID=A0A1E5KTH6_9ENTE|nr:sulfurtransferase-like selenium metabolism protein YedF [Enterococcus rivorum]MBP2097945.1 selenium metabolism protein YedF [Enterococcus rivorum]OEH81202.1 hypothetical protein BCR26_04975 [Enterococcus rivorum]
MEKINALGKPCPIPVIETKKAIRKLAGQAGTIEVLVDNDIARQNIEKMATGMGIQTIYKIQENNEILVTLTVAAADELSPETKSDSGFVVAFGKKTMGEGAPDLGEMLLKSYIYSLTELDTPPEHLLFFNSGAYLTSQGSDVIKDLKTLSEKGTMISTCGTCLDFYGIQQDLAIGEITNMYGISEIIAQANKVMTF